MESLPGFSSMSDLPSFSRDDIRYAAEMTRVVYEPDRRIDTFGDTRFNFLLLSELMDEVNVVRVRSGWGKRRNRKSYGLPFTMKSVRRVFRRSQALFLTGSPKTARAF